MSAACLCKTVHFFRPPWGTKQKIQHQQQTT